MSIYNRVCRECGKTFQGGPRAWYCPECRYERKLERQRRYQITGFVRKIGSTDYCEMCGKPYTVNSGLQRYCPECAKINQRETDRRLSLKYYGDNKDTLNPNRNAKRREIWRKEHVKKKRDVVWTIANGDGNLYETDNVTDFVRQYIAQDKEAVIKIRGRLYEMWYNRQRKHTDRDYNGWKIIDKKIANAAPRGEKRYKMKYQDYIAHVEEAKGYSSAREFLGQYGFPADCPYTAESVIKFCNIIFAVAHQDFGALANISGASRDAFARSRGIPQRSYSNWTYGRTKAPDYIAELIGYSMLEDLPKDNEE